MNKIVLFVFYLSSALTAKSQTADFTYTTSDGLLCNPSTVQFTSSFTGTPKGFVWTFGNGSGSNLQNPSITYSTAGSYTVKLTVIYGQTTAVATKTIIINPSITAAIGYDRNYICKPGVINFTATSSGNIGTYNWDFGDGSALSTSTNTTAHNFSALGVYNVKLLATAVTGCYSTSQTEISVETPPISGTVSPTSGCIPANVSFYTNATIPANSSVTNYLWNFGDGSPLASTKTNSASHIYSTAGNYTPSLNITTSEGCTSSYTYNPVAFGTPPTNHIAYPEKTVICGSDDAVLVSKATNANSYHWDFGDGQTANVTDTVARHRYLTLGLKNVTVTPSYNGCNGTPISFQVTVIGVIASYNHTNSCADKKTFIFSNTSQGNLSTESWDFGDGSPFVNTLNTTHTFPTSGSFITRLTVMDSITGCSASYSQTIFTSDPSLVNSDSSVCKNTEVTFSVVNTYNDPAATYTWHVAGKQAGPFKDTSYTVSATIFGNFNDYVIIDNGAHYCRDTIRLNHTLLVRGPNLSFIAPSSLCFDSLYSVTNTSKPFIPTDSVNLWYWNFGMNNNVNDSIYQPQPFAYSGPGTYNVKLTGIDINGCKDSLVKPITIHPLPYLYLIPAVDTLCSGVADTLLAFHSDNIIWSPSNSLTCSTCDTVLTNASANTKYYIKATTQFGCTVMDSILVKVYPPFTAVASANDVYICLNDTAHLYVDPPGKRIVWSPPTGLSDPNNYGPVVAPKQTTAYTATLTDSVGCFTSTVSINVHVKSLPTVEAGPDQSYPYNSPFTINPVYSNNIANYEWTPGNLLSCTTCPDPSGIATGISTFFINVTSDSGCVAKDSLTIFVECKDANLLMPTAFTPNNDNINDYFYPLARGIKSITRFSIYNRFGKLVFEAKNFPPNDRTYGWNGQVKGADQSTSIFVYYLEALCYSGERLYKKGSVVLIR